MTDALSPSVVAVVAGAVLLAGAVLVVSWPDPAPAGETGPWTVQVVTAFNASAYPNGSDERSPRADLPPGTPAVNGTLLVESTEYGGSMEVEHSSGDGGAVFSTRLPREHHPVAAGSPSNATIPPGTGSYRFPLGSDGGITLSVPGGTNLSFLITGEVPDPPDDCRARYRADPDQVRTSPTGHRKGSIVPVALDLTVEVSYAVKCVPRNTV